jgi:hypothetical protein
MAIGAAHRHWRPAEFGLICWVQLLCLRLVCLSAGQTPSRRAVRPQHDRGNLIHVTYRQISEPSIPEEHGGDQ